MELNVLKRKRYLNRTVFSLGLVVMALWPSSHATAQESWTPEQQQVLAAMGRLSAATAPDGGGASEYGAVLAADFTRWTVGSSDISDKTSWVQGIQEWFEDGWRVSDRQTQHVEIVVRNDLAFTRRIVEETYLGPDGERSVSGAALAEVWVRGDHGWLLLRVDVHPMEGG